MENILFAAAAFIFVCLAAGRAGSRMGMPTLLLFILLGMLCGSEGILGIGFEDYELTEKVCSIALLFIIFYGGFGTRWSEAKPVAAKAIVLSSLGTVLTALSTGLFCHVALKMDLLEGLLLGSVLGSTDAASVFFILRSRKLGLKDGSASLLEMESGSNDPFAYMMTVIVLSLMDGTADGTSVLMMLVTQVLAGIFCGVLVGLLGTWILRKSGKWSDGSASIFVFGAAMLSYALPAAMGGNGYLGAYVAGIILGNQEIEGKRNLVGFFDALTGIMQMVLFFMMGLLATPSAIVPLFIPSLLLALFMTFLARPLAVGILLAPFRPGIGQWGVVSWAGLRGAASIAFAIMAMNGAAAPGHDIFHMVFSVVLLSILFQGSLLPAVSRLFRMTDSNSDVMKTFTDYTEERRIDFIPVRIGSAHPWKDKVLEDIGLLPDMLMAFISRGKETIVPKGDTILREGDTAYVCTEGLDRIPDIRLSEISIDGTHRWCGRHICEMRIPSSMIVMIVIREGRSIVPDGSTLIKAGDTLVVWSRND